MAVEAVAHGVLPIETLVHERTGGDFAEQQTSWSASPPWLCRLTNKCIDYVPINKGLLIIGHV